MNHELIKEDVFALYDGQLSSARTQEIQAHLQVCSACRDLLENWKKISDLFVPAFHFEQSELFVRQVMRRVRVLSQKEERMDWGHFSRWAFPTLAMSVIGFMAVLIYTSSSMNISTEGLLMKDQEQSSIAEWFSVSPNEGQLLDTVAKP